MVTNVDFSKKLDEQGEETRFFKARLAQLEQKVDEVDEKIEEVKDKIEEQNKEEKIRRFQLRMRSLNHTLYS